MCYFSAIVVTVHNKEIIPYSRKLSRDKTFANGQCSDFNFANYGIIINRTLIIIHFSGLTFANGLLSAKIVKPRKFSAIRYMYV